MIMHICDRCGRLIRKRHTRYIAKIQVFAAADPLEITLDDLARDHTREIEEILRHCEGLSEDELMRDVFVEFEFSLCSSCQKEYVERPLPP